MSHSLELDCKVPMGKCPRAMGSMAVWIKYSNTMQKYMDNKSKENAKLFQEALDDWAKYCGMKPRSMPFLIAKI
jgi:hypothetical protein